MVTAQPVIARNEIPPFVRNRLRNLHRCLHIEGKRLLRRPFATLWASARNDTKQGYSVAKLASFQTMPE